MLRLPMLQERYRFLQNSPHSSKDYLKSICSLNNAGGKAHHISEHDMDLHDKLNMCSSPNPITSIRDSETIIEKIDEMVTLLSPLH